MYAVMLTGRSAKEDVVSGMEAGADDFLAKPFDKNELFVRTHEGQRIVELERSRRRAEARCSHMHTLVTRCAKIAERDLDQALDLLCGDARTPRDVGAHAQAIARISSARELISLLHSDAEQCVRQQLES